MPWKIKPSTNIQHSADPQLTMWDPTVGVHLQTHLESGVIDLWIGGPTPQLATIWISIDSERIPVCRSEPTGQVPTNRDRMVISTVLRSLGQDPQKLLGRQMVEKRRFSKPRPKVRPGIRLMGDR